MKSLPVILGLWCLPGIVAAQDPNATREREDSIAISGSLGALLTDSVAAAQRARVVADSLLAAPIGLWPEAPVLTDDVRRQLRAKIWLLYFNPSVRVRLAPVPGTQGASRDLMQVTGDSIRSFFRASGVDLAGIVIVPGIAYAVRDTLAPLPTPEPAKVQFISEGQLVQTTIPSTSAAPPEPSFVNRRLWRDGRETYRWGTVRIFYATDRERTSDAGPESFYAGTRAPSGAMEFGRVEVTVPRMHRQGVIERPVWYKLERSTDPSQHMTVKRVDPLTQLAMHDSLRRVISSSDRKEALVFIHGFNVSFTDAAMRTAQLAYDLGFDGAPILYSWPSRGSIFRYSADRENAEFSAQHLATFLDSVTAISGAKQVHVIAHSMGNRVLTLALERLALQGRDTLINNMVLAAADVDAVRFDQQIAPRIRPLVRRMTVYVSGQDKALRASRILSSNLRLGEASSPILVVNGTETIDASAIPVDLLGHGYIGSADAVIEDLLQVINGQAPPRPRLRALQSASGASYWVLSEKAKP